jgi:alginate O-acetyltransferase complex protein AlgI
MLFNSLEFLFVFLPCCLLLLHAARLLGRRDLYLWICATASLVFYSYLSLEYLPLFMLSVLVNSVLGERLRARRERWPLRLGLAFNIGLLVFFKYSNFLLANISAASGQPYSPLALALPLGISFYTFTQTAYLVDASRGGTVSGTLGEYAAFVTIFPHLVAGPILHHHDIMEQFRAPGFLRPARGVFQAGLVLLLTGMVKKMFIADLLGPWAGHGFRHWAEATFIDAWAAALAYTFQLYYDFSGYTDMALGLGLMLNVRLPENFSAPYQSCSIIEFWRRWHMTLSAFLKDYIYIPLGGNRLGQARRYVNLLLTMLVGGIWHGAGWTFALWGLGHGAMLAANHAWRSAGGRLPRALAWPLTFVAVVMLWVLFRAPDAHTALELLKAMCGLKGCVLPERYAALLGGLSRFGVSFADVGSLLPGGKLQMAVTAVLLLGIPLRKEQLFARVFGHGELAAPGAPGVSFGFACAALTGVVCFCVVKAMFVAEPSEFLYFNF